MDNYTVYDEHTLYLKCDSATVEQIRTSFSQALLKYKREVDPKFQCRTKVNLLETRDGKSIGVAFVYLTNPAAYYLFLGKNADGSDRIQYVDDETWVPPVSGETTNKSGWSSVDQEIDWGDLSDENDCPKIASQQEPLMVLPPYKLSPEQIEQERQNIIEDNLGKPDFDETLVKVSEEGYYGVDRAFSFVVDKTFMPNILKTSSVPPWISKEDLKSEFRNFATDSITLQERQVKGITIKESFPYVNINDGRVAFVIFDPSTNDAYFALHMMKKTTIQKKLQVAFFKNRNPFEGFFPDVVWKALLNPNTNLGSIKFNGKSDFTNGVLTIQTDFQTNKSRKLEFTITKTDSGMMVKTFNTCVVCDGTNIDFTTTLMFSHSYKSDRDLMANICQQPRPVNKRNNRKK